MKLVPRYDAPPVLEVTGWVDDPAVPLLRQRRRLASVLATLDAEQWAAPSRCEGWTVQDVVAHLIGTNQFWALSIAAGLDGAPTRFLGSFDPAATPEQMVDSMRSMAPAEILEQFAATTEEMARVVDPLTADDWPTKAESPPGHVALTALAAHALWDSWVHERDVVVPLGLTQPLEVDEVGGCLRYAAALGPALGLNGGSTRGGALAARDRTRSRVRRRRRRGPSRRA